MSSEQLLPELAGKSSAQILVAIDGQGALVADGFDRLNSPRAMRSWCRPEYDDFAYSRSGKVQFLKSHVPGVAVADPETCESERQTSIP